MIHQVLELAILAAAVAPAMVAEAAQGEEPTLSCHTAPSTRSACGEVVEAATRPASLADVEEG